MNEGPRLFVRLIVNSSMEEVLGWKCVNLQGMNMELHVTNEGRDTMRLRSEAVLMAAETERRIDYLYPHGVHELGPHQGLAFYFGFDEDEASRFDRVGVADDEGALYVAKITGSAEKAMKRG